MGDTGEVINNPKDTYTGEKYVVKYIAKDQNQKYVFKVDNEGNVEKNEPVVLPDGLQIGTEVTYSPSGSYTWDKQYATADTTGTDSLSSAEGQTYRVTSWKVLSIDEDTGDIELISTQPVGSLRLQGAPGYNNAVYLLNDACNKLYGNGTTIKGRNVNIEDIEERMTETALNADSTGAHKYSNGIATYGNQVPNAYTYYNNYPIIYEKEIRGFINNNANSGTGLLGESEQDSLIERDEASRIAFETDGKTPKKASSGYIKAGTNIKPYQTFWCKNNSFMQTAFKAPLSTETDGAVNTNYKLLMTKGDASNTTVSYWLASRCIDNYSSYCGFGVSFVHSGFVSAYNMFYSGTNPGNFSLGLRPIVSLSSELVSGDNTTGFKVE